MEKTILFSMFKYIFDFTPTKWKKWKQFSLYFYVFVFISTNLKIFHNIDAFDFQEVEKPFMIYIISEK